MTTPLKIVREFPTKELERRYKIEKNARIKERLLMVRLVKESKSCREVARVLKRSPAIITIWIKRFNKEGIKGLKDKPRSGRPSKLSKEETKELKEDLKKSPQDQGYKQHHWTTRLVRYHIKKKFSVEYKERNTRDILRKLGFSLVTPRKRHYKADPREQEEFRQDFKKTTPVERGRLDDNDFG